MLLKLSYRSAICREQVSSTHAQCIRLALGHSKPLSSVARLCPCGGLPLRVKPFRKPPSASLSINAVAVEPAENVKQESSSDVEYKFCCPICLSSSLTVSKDSYRQTASLSCPRCQRSFEDTGVYVDLTLTSGVPKEVFEPRAPPSQELFRSPLVSFVYERGWRQAFRGAGFPGPDVEFERAMEYLRPVYGQTLLDMSCGSGLFSRRFIKCGKFKNVIAADFSENMLRQTQQFIADDPTIQNSDYCIARADVGRLPFATGSVAAVHAGAAIHCWPDPQAALAEISRVLQPGGVFVGSTFMTALAPVGQLLGDELVRPLSQRLDQLTGLRGGFYRWWDEQELRDLASRVGLTNFQRDRDNRFILFAMQKPDVV